MIELNQAVKFYLNTSYIMKPKFDSQSASTGSQLEPQSPTPHRYYVRISLADGYAANMTKNVTVSVNQGYDYTVFVPLSLYCLVCLFFATMITWGFFRVFSYSCDLPCYASWRKTVMGYVDYYSQYNLGGIYI